jgi:hypothetical protein
MDGIIQEHRVALAGKGPSDGPNRVVFENIKEIGSSNESILGLSIIDAEHLIETDEVGMRIKVCADRRVSSAFMF